VSKKRQAVWFGLAGFSLAAIGLFTTPVRPAVPTNDLAIIVNKQNSVQSISLADLRKVFRGEQQFWNGQSTVLLLVPSPGSQERKIALSVLYQTDEAGYQKYWLGKIFRAEIASGPLAVETGKLMGDGIATFAGAIGCEDARNVSGDVKVVRVNGHLPGEAEYPLKY
jgi:ABC-type phosphate transport system substrate-binding protein